MGNTSRLKTLTLSTFAILLAGCQSGSGGGASTTGGTAANGGKKYKIGVSIPAADHGWTAGIKYWADQATKDNPDIEWTIQDAKEPKDQINSLENMKTQGMDAIVILATESAPITPIAKKLHDAGILIVNVDRGFTEPVADVYIEGDNKAFGTKSANFIVEKLGAKGGKIAILEGIPSTVNTDRVTAAKEVFKAHPEIQIVADAPAFWNREKAFTATQNFLGPNPQIDAIWAADDDMALGAENALKQAGRDKNIWILGGGCMKDIIKRMMDKDPMYPGEITYPPSMIGYGIETAAAIMRAGKERALKYTPKHVLLDVEIVLPDRAKDFYFPDSVY
ncbi:MAG TPA: ABC transporter substrate-binding protein [Fimbriimonadaceae bacterium]|nr:ABC transporter substrate-binding protein [Fimbriimonadaceae bacterium]